MIMRSGRLIWSGPVNKWDGYGNNDFGSAGNRVLGLVPGLVSPVPPRTRPIDTPTNT